MPVDPKERSRPYLVMEYLEGQTLDEVMQQVKPMPEADALRIVSRLCDAIGYLHEHGVIHRDLKPQNVMLCNDGSLRIMDFGIAKAAASRRITFGGFSPTLGTPDYMAPEQVKGQRGRRANRHLQPGRDSVRDADRTPAVRGPERVHGDERAAGRRPGGAAHATTRTSGPEVEEIVLHAMARDPAERYPSAAAMKADIDAPEQRPRDRAGQPSEGPGPDARAVADRPDRPARAAGAGRAVLPDPVHVDPPLADA